jgi:hypothetical protein
MTWTLSWTPSPSKDVIAYFVEVGGKVVARVNADTTSAVMPTDVATEWVVDEAAGEKHEVATFTVDTVTRSGGHTLSAPVSATPVLPSMVITSSLGGVEYPVPTGPFTLTWSLDPMYAPAVATWKVTYAGTTTSLPVGQPTFVVDPTLNQDPYEGRVEVETLDPKGHSLAYESFSFYTPLWASENL